MGRITNTGDTPAKRRRQHVRSCAEALRALAQHPGMTTGRLDAEALDLAAFLAFNLRGITDTIETSAEAWDDRDYWRKAEELRHRYRWAGQAADEIEALLLADRGAALPALLVTLVPHFQDVTIAKTMRDADWWCGAFRALQRRAAKAA